jgi:hypothetical protein
MRSRSACVSVLLALSAAPAFAHATITILTYEPTKGSTTDPAAPVGGNPGATIERSG